LTAQQVGMGFSRAGAERGLTPRVCNGLPPGLCWWKPIPDFSSAELSPRKGQTAVESVPERVPVCLSRKPLSSGRSYVRQLLV